MTQRKEKEWYFQYQEQWYGPISQQEITMLLTQKKIDAETKVWTESFEDAKALKDTILALHSNQDQRIVKSKTPFVHRGLAVLAGVSLLVILSGSIVANGIQDQKIQEERIAQIKKEKKKKEQGAMTARLADTNELKKGAKKTIDEYLKEEKEKAEQEQEQATQEASIQQDSSQQAPAPQTSQQTAYTPAPASQSAAPSVQATTPSNSFEVYTAPESINPRGIEVFNEGTPQEYWIDWGNG